MHEIFLIDNSLNVDELCRVENYAFCTSMNDKERMKREELNSERGC